MRDTIDLGLPRWMQGDWAANAPLGASAAPLSLGLALRADEPAMHLRLRRAEMPAPSARGVRGRRPVTLLAAIMLALASSLTIAAKGLALPEHGLTVRLPPAEAYDAPQTGDVAPTQLTAEAAEALRVSIAEELSDGDFTGPKPPALALNAASAGDRVRALRCMTDAVYYEAANEPEPGMRAVAQVVINRVRHPEWPNSVCGVVYQGAERASGCQFSFTCDGSLARGRSRAAWARSQRIAEEALDGHEFGDVGMATYYHTFEVWPHWGRRLTMTNMIGRHLFHRLAGGAGGPAAFTQHYSGHEAGPTPWTPRATATASAADVTALLLPAQPQPPLDNLPPAPTPRTDTAQPIEHDDNLPDSHIRPEFQDSGRWIGG